MSEFMDSPHDGPTEESLPEPADDPDDESGADSTPAFDTDTIRTYLHWGALFGFVILAVVAGIGLYSSLGSIITVWVAPEYRPIARSGLNLALLAAAVAGIVAILRRL